MMTPAQKRDIFYRAAAYIEAHPEDYNVLEVRLPNAKRMTGCMWGHVARIAGISGSVVHGVPYAFGFEKDEALIYFGNDTWGDDVELVMEAYYAARLMRAFADHHWPAPVKPVAMRFPELMRSLGAEVV